MIAVTDGAKDMLKGILTANVDNPLAVLRLTVTESGGLGLGIDVEKLNDRVVEHEGSTLLVVAEELADSLVGITLDIEDTPEGPQLAVYREPEEEL